MNIFVCKISNVYFECSDTQEKRNVAGREREISHLEQVYLACMLTETYICMGEELYCQFTLVCHFNKG